MTLVLADLNVGFGVYVTVGIPAICFVVLMTAAVMAIVRRKYE